MERMTEDAPEPKLVLDDDDFLAIVAEQRRQSIGFGFDNDDELAKSREQSLNYLKGQMDDVPVSGTRSRAVSSDVSDAIETALPDLIEIFIGGDDVATFQADSAEDEAQAKLETEVVTQTIFDHNAGFLLFYSMIKDALTCKIGVAKSWWEDGEEVQDEPVSGIDPAHMDAIRAEAKAQDIEICDEETAEDGSVSFTSRRTVNTGCQKNVAVPPEDFTFARDTVLLRETTYCAMRSRPRAQALVDQGYDADDVDSLPDYSSQDDATDQARDTAGENRVRVSSDAIRPLRPVEIVEHYVRVDADGDGKTEIWRVVTGGGETVLLEKERVESIPFSAITPYITPHRLLGRSLADLLLEIQRIKTALLRMLLDSGYFALNQRMEVADVGSNSFTISDLLQNEPAMPVRSKTGQAVRAIASGGLNFDVTGALEFISTVAEQRTGIVRNAQGLNPDTLHDTADGARQLIAAAQKRIRLIGRVFAETGIKDLFLNVHEILRTKGRPSPANVGGQWTNVDPTQWRPRKGLRVEIGVGSGGREHDIMAGNALLAMQEKAVEAQGGSLDGPLINAASIHAAVSRQTELLGYKSPEQYWVDPQKYAAAQAAKGPQQAPPDPKVLELQQRGQIARQQAQATQQQAAMDAQAQAHAQQLAEQAQAFDQRYKWVALNQQAELALAEIQARYKTQVDTAQIKAEAENLRVGADLTIKAAGHNHDLTMAAHEAQHAKELVTHEAMHDHVAAIRDAALAPDPEPDASDSNEPAESEPS